MSIAERARAQSRVFYLAAQRCNEFRPVPSGYLQLLERHALEPRFAPEALGTLRRGARGAGCLPQRGRRGDKAFNWNTGICATGAGLGQKALDAWLAENFKIALGVDGMPEGGFPDVQVRISSRGPLGGPPCEPDPDAPGYEYGWVRAA